MNELQKLDDLNIKTHNFNIAKDRIKKFSNTDAVNIEIKKVQTEGGFFGLIDHRVTGAELNNRMSIVQDHFITLNECVNKTIKEFGEIYNALEFLDKDYINGILIAIKGIQKNHFKIEATQERTNKIVDTLKQAIEKFKIFKATVDGYEHLKDIDFLWEQGIALCNKVTEILGILDELDNNVGLILKEARNNKNSIDNINKKLNSVEHFNDIDNIWNNSINNKNSIDNINKKLNSIKHFNDIDNIWNTLIKNNKIIEEFKEASSNIENIKNENSSKLKKANTISIIAIGISIIQLIFILTKVM